MRKTSWMQNFIIVYGTLLLLFILYLYNYAWFCKWHFHDSRTRFLLIGDPQIQGDARIRSHGFYGQVDVWYNDFYLRHISDNLMHYLQPSHVFILGDLFSSQYITDTEFEHRVSRYRWIYKNVNVPFYNLTGNHDIGYGSDITYSKIARFEAAFGKVDDRFFVENHIIAIVNSMNLDKSSYEAAFLRAWENLEAVKNESQETGLPVIVMKHIPLHKEDFDFTGPKFKNFFAKVRERELCAERAEGDFDGSGNANWHNMMSPNTTDYILDELQPVFVINGHDHDGCIYRHNNKTVEFTVRSVMGDFGGYAAMFEIVPRVNEDGDEAITYDYYYTPCPFVYLSTVTITGILSGIWLGISLLYCICSVCCTRKWKKPKEL